MTTQELLEGLQSVRICGRHCTHSECEASYVVPYMLEKAGNEVVKNMLRENPVEWVFAQVINFSYDEDSIKDYVSVMGKELEPKVLDLLDDPMDLMQYMSKDEVSAYVAEDYNRYPLVGWYFDEDEVEQEEEAIELQTNIDLCKEDQLDDLLDQYGVFTVRRMARMTDDTSMIAWVLQNVSEKWVEIIALAITIPEYQENFIANVLDSMANGQKAILISYLEEKQVMEYVAANHDFRYPAVAWYFEEPENAPEGMETEVETVVN